MAKKKPNDQSARASIRLDRAEIPWLLCIAFATGAPHAEHLPVWLSLLAAAVLLWRYYLWQHDRPLPPRSVLLIIVAASVAGIAWEFRTLFGKDPGVALLALFMALKPLEMRSRRDAMVVIMLGFFLLLTHYLYSQTILTGIWLLAAAAVLTATLIRLHGGSQSFRSIARLSGLLLLQSLPFMFVFFLLVPRVQGPLWGLPRDAFSGMSGLSDEMSPGSLNNLIQSGDIAFRVQFAETPPDKSKLYWRGPVLADFNGTNWRRSPGAQLPSSAGPVIERHGTEYNYIITLEPHNQRWLLALDLPTKLPADAALSPLVEARSRAPVVFRTRLAFSSVPDAVANVSESTATLRSALQLPAALNPRTRVLAQTWRNDFQTPEKIASAALRFFRTEAFYYTLQPPLLGEHAIDDFLFSTRRGFCEHYAAAFVVLMRAAGVPARVVTGYQGGETNPIDGYMTVRQSDAHAWAEIWIADKGWLRFDPTGAVAPSRIERGIRSALPESDPLPALLRIDRNWLLELRNRWEAMDNAWNQWVLGYNPQRQREFLSRLGLNSPDWQQMIAVLAALSATLVGIIAALTFVRRRRGDPAQEAWITFCGQLARRGVNRADWEGPQDFSRRASTELPALAPLIMEAAHHYITLRYGNGDSGSLDRLKKCTQQLRRMPQPHRRVHF